MTKKKRYLKTTINGKTVYCAVYCEDCNSRKGFKRGQYKILYEIGEAPCRACGIDDMLNDVEDFPAADVRPVVRGKWVEDDDEDGKHCSICGEDYCYLVEPCERYHYCPHCGADLREATDG